MAMLGMVIERDNHRLDRIAHQDALTGCLNRAGLLSHREVATGPHGVLVADLDHFTQLNDQYRHAAGERYQKTQHVLHRHCSDTVRGLEDEFPRFACRAREFVNCDLTTQADRDAMPRESSVFVGLCKELFGAFGSFTPEAEFDRII